MKMYLVIPILLLFSSSAYAEAGTYFCFASSNVDAQRCGNAVIDIFGHGETQSQYLSTISSVCDLSGSTQTTHYSSDTQREDTWEFTSPSGNVQCAYYLEDEFFCPDTHRIVNDLSECDSNPSTGESISDNIMEAIDVPQMIQDVLSVILIIILIIANFLTWRKVKQALDRM